MSTAPHARYLFHWLSVEQLRSFDRSGHLAPAWTHFVIGVGREVVGTSTSSDPLLWTPDEELDREPCLVIDAASLGCPVHAIRSWEAYHTTRELAALRRDEGDVGAFLQRKRRISEATTIEPDEIFVEGVIGWESVVAIGYETRGQGAAAARIAADEVAEARVVPALRLGAPGLGRPSDDEIEAVVDAFHPHGCGSFPP
ncbi:hypothetical protein BHAOGJBA_1348 [Methylobacterium hispanicum]|uniref:Uncharacterized protein n=2 Tax=Methylobacterium hispanicum TaxID=270350 RepID=A0AAV4ZIW7_9HYPH|nr:hypothetical protein BHAOGJBA_1348 [Methylobacterium hispanicum]